MSVDLICRDCELEIFATYRGPKGHGHVGV